VLLFKGGKYTEEEDVKDISPKSYIFWQICKIFRQNCISFANFVIRIKHISTEFVKELLLKCAYFT
jgi:hypothetical protein